MIKIIHLFLLFLNNISFNHLKRHAYWVEVYRNTLFNYLLISISSVSGMILMKPAHCSNVLGPIPFTDFSCSLFIKGPFVFLYSTILAALGLFSPESFLKKRKMKVFWAWNEYMYMQNKQFWNACGNYAVVISLLINTLGNLYQLLFLASLQTINILGEQ